MMDKHIPSEDSPNLEKVFESLAITMHLGYGRNPDTIIGWANAFRNTDDGTTTIIMTLDPEASERLKDLAEVFKLYALGFAGVAKPAYEVIKADKP